MALPLVRRVRREFPDVQIVYTFFSPSAERFASGVGADFVEYLPFDSAAAMKRVVVALRPTALVFSKLDVWPVLVETAHGAGVKLGLVSASMPERSRRYGIGGMVTRDAYRALDVVGAASEEDARRLVVAGVRADRVRVTGDTRYDQAWERAHVVRQNTASVDAVRCERPTVVAGSTWGADENVVLSAWEQVVRDLPQARIIIAPHEIGEKHLQSLERWADTVRLRHARLGAESAVDADVIIVDRVGALADLYALATVAYVGGGFHAAGLHSVVEPAVFHVPTIVGPRHESSRDAVAMREAGGIRVAGDAAQMASVLRTVLSDREEHERMSRALARVVSSELGAVDRSFEIVRVLLGRV
jgi:3-deoxy-D-manno-octulosonic-acid transferase